jgi:hypothetical protein
MAQVTLYMDEDTLSRVRKAAEAAGVSVSAWVAELVRERTRNEWPPEVAELAGAWPDFPLAGEIRAGEGQDSPREKP